MRAEYRHRAHRLIAEQHSKGKVWTGTVKQLESKIRKTDQRLIEALMRVDVIQRLAEDPYLPASSRLNSKQGETVEKMHSLR